MLSLAAYRAELCPVCGNPKAVCQAATSDSRFTVPPPARCHATTAIRRAQNEGEREYPEALVWSAQLAQ